MLRVTFDGTTPSLPVVAATSYLSWLGVLPTWMTPDPLLNPVPAENTPDATSTGTISTGAAPATQYLCVANLNQRDFYIYTLSTPIPGASRLSLQIADIALPTPSVINVNGFSFSYLGKDLDI